MYTYTHRTGVKTLMADQNDRVTDVVSRLLQRKHDNAIFNNYLLSLKPDSTFDSLLNEYYNHSQVVRELCI